MPKKKYSCYLCLCYKKDDKRTKTQADTQPSSISFHQFPKDPNIRQTWLDFCGLSEEVDDVSSKVKICSLHFTDNDYIEPNAKNMRGRRMMLKKNAVPSTKVPYTQTSVSDALSKVEVETCEMIKSPIETITLPEPEVCAFTSPANVSHLLEFPIQQQSELRDVDEQKSADEEEIIHTPKKRKFFDPRYIFEIKMCDVSTPERAQKTLSLARRIFFERNRKIKFLQEKNRYLSKRVARLKDSIRHLKTKG